MKSNPAHRVTFHDTDSVKNKNRKMSTKGTQMSN